MPRWERCSPWFPYLFITLSQTSRVGWLGGISEDAVAYFSFGVRNCYFFSYLHVSRVRSYIKVKVGMASVSAALSLLFFLLKFTTRNIYIGVEGLRLPKI